MFGNCINLTNIQSVSNEVPNGNSCYFTSYVIKGHHPENIVGRNDVEMIIVCLELYQYKKSNRSNELNKTAYFPFQDVIMV